MLLDPIRSVVDFSFYKTVGRKSIGASIGYLAYIGILFSAAVTAAMYINVRPLINEAVEWAAASVPTMTLSGGKLSSSLAQPTLIQHPKVKEAAFMIDTGRSAPVSAAEMSEKKLLGYVTQDAIYLMTRDRMETYPLDKARAPKPLTIDASFFRAVGEGLNRMLYPVSLVVTWFMFMVWKHLAALIYSVAALILNAALSAGLDYPTLYKSSVYAQTPVVVLQAVAMFLNRPIYGFNWLCMAIACVYLWKAVRMQRDSSAAPAA